MIEKMKHQYSITLFLVIFIFAYCSNPTQAVNPVNNKIEKTSEIHYPELPDHSGTSRKSELTWKEKLALKIIEKKIKKARKKWSKEGKFSTNITQEDRCHTLILKTGEELKVLLYKVTETEVVYKPCGQPEGDEITIPIEEVVEIKTKYGQVIFKHPGYANLKSKKKLEVFALAAPLSSIIGLALFFTVSAWSLMFVGFSLLFILISITRFHKNPEKYGGRGFIILAVIPILILIAMILFFPIL